MARRSRRDQALATYGEDPDFTDLSSASSVRSAQWIMVEGSQSVMAGKSTIKTSLSKSMAQNGMTQSPEDRAKGLNPASELVTRGWLRASHRALDPERSSEMEPYHTHAKPEAIVPGEVYRFDISLEPMAYLFRKDHRIRLEIVNGDSPATEVLWTHYYRPDKIGRDTVHHDGRYPSALILPVTSG